MTQPLGPRANSPLVFMHVPRTAGSSLRQSVSAALGGERFVVDVYDDKPAFTRASAPDRLTPLTRLVYGHVSYGFHEMLGIAPRYATVLRNPVERVVSLHRYLAARDSKIGAMSLHAFAASDTVRQASNHLTEMLAGPLLVQAQPEEALAIAKERLDGFEFVGLTETLRRDSRALFRLLGCKRRRIYRHNRSNRGPAPEAATLDIIRERNRLDLALYEHVRSRRADVAGKERQWLSWPIRVGGSFRHASG